MRRPIEQNLQLWKSQGGIDEGSPSRPSQARGVVSGKLWARVVPPGTIGMGGGTRADRSPIPAARLVGA